MRQIIPANSSYPIKRALQGVTNRSKPPATETKIFLSAVVVDVEDPKNSRRIRVKIPGIEDNKQINQLPWCVCMMPPFFFCLPKVGEHVLLFLQNPWTLIKGRYWVGPIMSKNETDEQTLEEMAKDLNIVNPSDF